MFGREQLERCAVKKWLHSEWEIKPDENGEFFWAEEANSVMNKMEARIKELEADLEKFQEAWLGERRAVVAARKERDEAIAELRKLEGLA